MSCFVWLVGYMKVEVKERKPRLTNGTVTSADGMGYVNEAYVVNGVLDPRVGREVSLEKACRQGLIDRERGIYVYPITNKEIPLDIAIQRGLLKARVADPILEANNPNLLIARVWKGPRHLEPKDFNKTIFEKLKDQLPLKEGGIKEQSTGKLMTVGEAYENGVLNFNPLHITNKKGEKFAMHEAAFLDLVDPHTARELFKVIEPNSLAALIEQKLLDPKTGEFYDKESKQRMTLAEAIDRGVLDADDIFYQEVASRNIMSLGAAVEGKKWDAETGLIIDPVSGREMTLAEAIDARVIEPCIYADKLANQICALKELKKHLNTKEKGIKHPVSGKYISIEEAILEGILDVPNMELVDISKTVENRTPLTQAIETRDVKEKTGKDILEALSRMTLGQLLNAKMIDANTGKFIHPETKRRMTLQEAIERGFLQPSVVFFEDTVNDRIASLQSFIDDGRFDAAHGKFRDPLTGLDLTIGAAIKKNVIKPDFNPEHFLSGKKTLADLMKAGKADPNSSVFAAPGDARMPLKDALLHGFLSPDSLVTLDAKSREISLAEPALASAVQALMATKQQLDWLDGVEAALAKHGTPGEHVDELQNHLDAYDVRRQLPVFFLLAILCEILLSQRALV